MSTDRQRAVAEFKRIMIVIAVIAVLMVILAPSMILFTVRLLAVASIWFALWLLYVLFVIRNFPRVRTEGSKS